MTRKSRGDRASRRSRVVDLNTSALQAAPAGYAERWMKLLQAQAASHSQQNQEVVDRPYSADGRSDSVFVVQIFVRQTTSLSLSLSLYLSLTHTLD